MIGHLGQRVSALLDGQLSAAETERAWTHVHQCHTCRDLVEREGWIKARLAGLSTPQLSAPPHLVGSLAADPLTAPHIVPSQQRSLSALTLLGGTAVGAVVVGVMALGVSPGATSIERRTPIGSDGSTQTPRPSPVAVSTNGKSHAPVSRGASARVPTRIRVPAVSTPRADRAGASGVRIGR